MLPKDKSHRPRLESETYKFETPRFETSKFEALIFETLEFGIKNSNSNIISNNN
jgi:hypothetical protein